MTIIHNLGLPRIGARRELKFALESYWKGESSLDELKKLGAALREVREAVQEALADNQAALSARRVSQRVIPPAVRAAVARIDAHLEIRESRYAKRAPK